MKQLIKKILKEQTQEEKYINLGMNVLIKVIKKSFPFIKGWKKGDEGKYNFYIYLIIDAEKTKEFYNSELLKIYKDYPELMGEGVLPYPFSILELRNQLNSEEKYELYQKIKNEVESTYENLPIEMIPQYTDPFTTSNKDISIDGFIIE